MADVFVVGALHWDLVVDAPRLPRPDETLFGSGRAHRFGGKGGNQAVAAARMGARTALGGRIGQDDAARSILEALDRAGVDRGQVRAAPGDTGMSVAIVDAKGDYGAVVVSGVNMTLDAKDIEPGTPRVLLLQNEVPEAVNRDIAARMREDGGTCAIMLNAAPARRVDPDLWKLLDVLVVNRVEAAQLTGRPPDSLRADDAARDLSALGPKAVIVTLGADGGAGLANGRPFDIAPPARTRGSAHGAGDMFVGALGAELAAGASVEAAAEFAAAAAACFVGMPPGAREGISRGSVEEWLAGL